MGTIALQDKLQQIILVAQGFYARKDRAHDLEHAYRDHIFTNSAKAYFDPLFLYMEGFWKQLHSERIKLSFSGQASSI